MKWNFSAGWMIIHDPQYMASPWPNLWESYGWTLDAAKQSYVYHSRHMDHDEPLDHLPKGYDRSRLSIPTLDEDFKPSKSFSGLHRNPKQKEGAS